MVDFTHIREYDKTKIKIDDFEMETTITLDDEDFKKLCKIVDEIKEEKEY